MPFLAILKVRYSRLILCILYHTFFLFPPFFSIFHSRQPSLDRHNVTRKLYTHIRAFHPSGLTHAHACVNVRAEYIPRIRSPALFPSASFCFFSLPAAVFSISPSPVFLVHLLGAVLAPPLFRPHTLDARRCAFPRRPSSTLSSLLFFFFSPFLLYDDVFPASSIQVVSTFMGFSEIKRIPCRGLGAGKFRRRASDANHLESERHKTCFGFSFLMMH